jgi:hypothetical protein
MTSLHDRLRLHGLDSPSGTIRARELHERCRRDHLETMKDGEVAAA